MNGVAGYIRPGLAAAATAFLAWYVGRMAAGELAIPMLMLLLLGLLALLGQLKGLFIGLIFLMGIWDFTEIPIRFPGPDYSGGGFLTVLPFLTALMLVLWLANVAIRGDRIVNAGALKLVLALLVVLVISSVAGTDPRASLAWSISFATAMSLTLLAVQLVRTPKDLQRVGWAIILSISVLALIINLIRWGFLPADLGEFATLYRGEETFQRVGGVVGGINPASVILMIGTAFTLNYWFTSGSAPMKILLLLCLTIIFIAQVHTVTLTGIIALTVVVVLTIFSAGKGGVTHRLAWSVPTLGIMLLIFFPVTGVYRDRVTYQLERSEEKGVEYLGSRRIALWEGAAKVAWHYPLLGTGPGTAQFFIPQYWPLPLDNRKAAQHTFLSMAANAGWIAAGLLVVIVGSVGWRLWRATGKAKRISSDFHVCGRAVLIALVATVVAGLFFDLERSRWLWLLLGLGMAYIEIVRRLEKQPEATPPPAQSVEVS